MAKNGGNKRRSAKRQPTKKIPAKKTSNTKTKNKITDSGKLRNARGVKPKNIPAPAKQPAKRLIVRYGVYTKSKKTLKKFFLKKDALFYSEKVNNPVLIKVSNTKKNTLLFTKKGFLKAKYKSVFFADLPIKKTSRKKTVNLKSLNSYSKIEKFFKSVKKFIYKGDYITSETKKYILKFSATLDDEKIKYNLIKLLNVEDIKNKYLITKDEFPKEIFYWNVQNLVIKNKFGEDIELELTDTDGKTIYKGKSEKKTGAALYKFNKQVDNLRKVIESAEKMDSTGFTIPIYETRRNGDTIKITIDLRGIKPRYTDIKKEVWDKYKTML